MPIIGFFIVKYCFSYNLAFIIDIMNINFFMNLAIKEAEKAYLLNEIPIGAILVDNKTHLIISSAHNEIIKQKNSIKHAEILLIERACKAINSKYLMNTSIFVTLEPCAMCFGAMVHARIERIVYGAHDLKTGVCGSCEDLSNANCFKHEINITGGVSERKCSQLLQTFFKSRR